MLDVNDEPAGDGKEYKRGRWEGQITTELKELKQDLAELRESVIENTKVINVFNEAQKQREAVALAFTEALNKKWTVRDHWIAVSGFLVTVCLLVLNFLSSLHII